MRRETKAERWAREHFNEVVTEQPCQFSLRQGHVCEPPLDAHHLLPKSFLRTRLGDWSEANRLAVMFNPLIGAPLCRLAHHLVEVRSDFIYWDELEPELIEWLGSLPDFLLLRLEIESPKRNQDNELRTENDSNLHSQGATQ